MSIASATAKSGPYAGNGVTVAFAIGFACQAATDLVVVRTDAAGNDTTLTYVTDYSVALNADQVATPGGTVTLVVAPATGLKVTILRNVALTQGTQLPNQGGWYPKVVENALDKLTMIVQQLSEKVSRAVVAGVTVDPAALIASIFSAATTSAAAASAASGSATAAAGSATAAAGSATAAAGSATAAAASAAAAASISLPAANATTTPLFLRSVSGAQAYSELGIKGANIASAATINLTTATGDFTHITGTVAITAITIPVGAQRTVVFDGVLTLTHGAALLLPGGANITTAANDRAIIRGDTAGAIVVGYTRADGQAVIPTAQQILATLNPSAAANVDALTVVTSAFDTYSIEIDGVKPSADDTLCMRVAVAGAVDSGATNYFNINLAGNATSGNSRFNLSSTVLAAGKGCNSNIRLNNVNDTSDIKTAWWSSTYQLSAAPQYNNTSQAGVHTPANAITGVSFFWAGGSNFVAAGEIRIYGLRN